MLSTRTSCEFRVFIHNSPPAESLGTSLRQPRVQVKDACRGKVTLPTETVFPRRACAARVTVVGLCVCLFVCLSTTILALQAAQQILRKYKKDDLLLNGPTATNVPVCADQLSGNQPGINS